MRSKVVMTVEQINLHWRCELTDHQIDMLHASESMHGMSDVTSSWRCALTNHQIAKFKSLTHDMQPTLTSTLVTAEGFTVRRRRQSKDYG